MSAAFPIYRREAHVTDNAAMALHAACRAFEVAGHRERLAKLYSLQCDACYHRSSTHHKTTLANLPFAADPRRFSLHVCAVNGVRRVFVLCPYCARRAKAGRLMQQSEPVKWLAYIPRNEPKPVSPPCS